VAKDEQLPLEKEDLSYDDRVEIEILSQSVNHGCELCDQRAFADAEAILRNSLKMLQQMDMLAIDETCFRAGLLKLAIATMSQEKWSDSEAILSRLVSLETPMGVDDAFTSEACFFMAQIYLARHEFDESLEYCQRARVGQRRLLGVQDLTYQRSTRLLTLIFGTRGDHTSSAAYRQLMPLETWIDNSDIAVLPWTYQGIGISFQLQAEAEKFLASNPVGRSFLSDPAPLGAQLRAAAEKGDINVIRLLISRGINVDLADKEDSTALQLACSSGYFKIAELLIQNGADVNRSNKGGRTPLNGAAKEGHRDIVKLLLEHDAEVDSLDERQVMTALIHSAAYGHGAIVQELLTKGAQLDAKSAASCVEPEKTALAFAAWKGHADIVATLIKAGADVNTRDKHWRTPLISAAQQTYNDKVLRLLLQAGADVSAADNHNCSAVEMAKKNKILSTVNLLMEYADA